MAMAISGEASYNVVRKLGNSPTDIGPNLGTKIGAPVCLAVGLAAIVVAIWLWYSKKKRQMNNDNGTVVGGGGIMVVGGGGGGTMVVGGGGTMVGGGGGGGGGNIFSIEVLRQATENFNEKNVLGMGGFGIVYKGQLEDGSLIAVKRMQASETSAQGIQEFEAEVGVLTRVRHRHLVGLLGFCSNAPERLLVYEYMPQGTLGEHLFNYEKNGTIPLTWEQRIAIALDVAKGVEYLHYLTQHTFIHRDLKSANILLGDDMRAKVADFGLVRKTPDGKESVETKIGGTFGYIPPECSATGRVTTKVDVYAYGAILMELITGRKALDHSMSEESVHLVTWFRRDILNNKENLRQAIDSTLDRSDETFGSICAVAELAGHCTAKDPNHRPNMRHTVSILVPLVEHWTPSGHEEDGHDIDLHESLSTFLKRWRLTDEDTTGDEITGPDEAVI